MNKSIARLAILFGIYVSLGSPAYAYLDPATGSIAVQAIIGAVATWIMYSRMFAKRAKDFLSRFVKGRNGSSVE
jgi:hypothetical protein